MKQIIYLSELNIYNVRNANHLQPKEESRINYMTPSSIFSNLNSHSLFSQEQKQQQKQKQASFL